MDEIIKDEGSSGADLAVMTIVGRYMDEQKLTIYSQSRLMNDSINSLSIKLEKDEVLNHCCFQMLNKNIQGITMLAHTRPNATITQKQSLSRATRKPIFKLDWVNMVEIISLCNLT